MRIFALQLDNDIKGIDARKAYIEGLVAQLPAPDLVVLPELALCSYMASQAIWQYADDCSRDASAWAFRVAQEHNTYLGVGYLDREDGDFFNRYLIAGPGGVCGTVSKSEGESAVFKRGSFGSIIPTPFGNIGVGICYDSRRKHFYDNVKDAELSLILFPHGCPADPTKQDVEQAENDTRCQLYADAFGVPVVYVNSTGSLEYMPGKMGSMMAKRGFRMNGLSRIYVTSSLHASVLDAPVPEAIGVEADVQPQRRTKSIPFHGQDILSGNWLFKTLVLGPDTAAGIQSYKKNHLAWNG